MYYLFSSDGCPACHQLHRDISEGTCKDWASHVTLVEIRYDKQDQCNKAYIDGKDTGKPPVDVVPAFYDAETENIIYGYQNIKDRLADGNKPYRG